MSAERQRTRDQELLKLYRSPKDVDRAMKTWLSRMDMEVRLKRNRIRIKEKEYDGPTSTKDRPSIRAWGSYEIGFWDLYFERLNRFYGAPVVKFYFHLFLKFGQLILAVLVTLQPLYGPFTR